MSPKFREQLRAAMGEMTQEALESASGVPQTSISRYLRGESEPTLSKLEALERALPALKRLRAKAAA
jgi:transcriptional regulator with XRE-family HTH domain